MSRSLLVFGAAALLACTAAAQADTVQHHRAHRLPPLSGTIRMSPQDFGAPHRGTAPPAVIVRRRPTAAPETVEVVRGGAYPQATTAYSGMSAADRWATGGTGLSGLIGNTGNPFAGQAAWGTADSATTGVAPPPRFAGVRRGLFTSAGADEPLTNRYGEPPIYPTAYDLPAYGAAPQMPFYGSGTPYSMSYYSSGSSAGPYGSPGGLGVYRSGSYGYGPRIVTLGARRPRWVRQGCTCGPRVVHLGRHHRRIAGR